MEPTRRALLRGVVLGAAGLAVGGLDAFPARAVVVRPGPRRPAGTTLERTLLRGSRQGRRGGYVPILSGPGERHLVRADLGISPHPGREGRRRPVAAFAQLTDIHLVDAQSPARVEWTDRYDDPPTGSPLIFSAAYRPHEMLTVQVADAMVRAIEQVGHGPVTGLPLQFVVCTGDNADNCQRNEVRWLVELLDGERVRPDSGSPARFEGVADWGFTADPHYWHPEPVPSGIEADLARSQYGFPTIPGLLGAARRPFRAHGLSIPWYVAYGNHDGLVQGNFPQALSFDRVARGPVKVVSAPAGLSEQDVASGLAADPSFLAELITEAPVREVTADGARAVLSRAETVAEYFRSSGRPRGHGFTARNVADGTAYYTFDQGQVSYIVLDTVNPHGYADGSLDQTQFAWLQRQLMDRSSRSLDANGGVVAGAGRDRLMVVCSHHTIQTMTNPFVSSPDDPGELRTVQGPQVEALLLRYPNVVLWVNGHTHVNQVIPHRRAPGSAVPGGFWELNTASHVDWPEQCRLIELVDNRDGTLSVFGTIVDSAAMPSAGHRTDSVLALASLSRELAANDWQERGGVTATVDGRRGGAQDRNVELVVMAPFHLAASPFRRSATKGSQPEAHPRRLGGGPAPSKR